MKRILILILTLSFVSSVFAQTNISVPLTDPVYSMLDYIEIRNYIKPLHNSRPYTLNLVLESLYESLESDKISQTERQTIFQTIERLSPQEPTEYLENGTSLQNLGEFAKTGTYRFEDTTHSFPISVELGTSVNIDIASNFNDPSISAFTMIDAFILGDLGHNFSYKVDFSAGMANLDFSSYSPYSFSPFWGGYMYGLDSLDSSFVGKTENTAAAIQFAPEFGVSLFENKLGLNFSRIRRDWGTGDGNLMISNNAQPFTAFEMYLHPVDFASLSFTTGVLEFDVDDPDGIKPTQFQNAFSAFMAELFITDYAYASLFSSVVFPKRFELAYMMPGMIPFFAQNTSGDFDNLLLGFSLGANIPGYAQLYFNILTDELNLLSDDFFHMDRNMYAFQTGIKASIPNAAFTVFNLQYTKLEPYMYTHPGTVTPWYAEDDGGEQIRMHTNYVNHGENLGYYLPPNSDELKLTATSLPFWFLETTLSYSLIRHGLEAYDETVDKLGNDIDSSLDYGDIQTPGDSSDNTSTKKYFLTDGTYEWIHSLGLEGEMDMRFVKDIPLTLKLGYTLSYTHHTEADVLNKSFKPVDNSEYKNTWGNYFTFSIKVW